MARNALEKLAEELRQYWVLTPQFMLRISYLITDLCCNNKDSVLIGSQVRVAFGECVILL